VNTSTRRTIVHLIDDVALGGVTRMLDALIPALANESTHIRRNVTPQSRWPDSIDGVDVAVVHSTLAWSKLPWLVGLRARMGQRPIIIIEHSYTDGLERELVTARTRFRRLLRLAYRFADRVVSVSEGQAAWMRTAQLLPDEKIVVIPPISPCAGLAGLAVPMRRTPSLAHPVRLAACGRFSRQKGFDDLLNAMGPLVGVPVHLTLAGYGPDEAALRARAAELPNVTITGPFSDPAAFLPAFDALVMPSLWEAYGLLAMEARLAGRPLIVSDVDGLPEQVTASSGFIVTTHDPVALTAAIRKLCTSDLSAMGEEARRSASQHIERSLAAWSSLISDVTGQRQVRASQTAPRFAT
jgi:D-inositol-3-phosphate glycosyltransferase